MAVWDPLKIYLKVELNHVGDRNYHGILEANKTRWSITIRMMLLIDTPTPVTWHIYTLRTLWVLFANGYVLKPPSQSECGNVWFPVTSKLLNLGIANG